MCVCLQYLARGHQALKHADTQIFTQVEWLHFTREGQVYNFMMSNFCRDSVIKSC